MPISISTQRMAVAAQHSRHARWDLFSARKAAAAVRSFAAYRLRMASTTRSAFFFREGWASKDAYYMHRDATPVLSLVDGVANRNRV